MRARTANYFLGSLLSRQSLYAYASAGGVTTGFQLLLLYTGRFSSFPTRTDDLPVLVEAYIETLLPIWIGEITPWNLLLIGINTFFALIILLWWTAKYSRSY